MTCVRDALLEECADINWEIRWMAAAGNMSVRAEVTVVGDLTVSFSSHESNSMVAVLESDLDLFQSAF